MCLVLLQNHPWNVQQWNVTHVVRLFPGFSYPVLAIDILYYCLLYTSVVDCASEIFALSKEIADNVQLFSSNKLDIHVIPNSASRKSEQIKSISSRHITLSLIHISMCIRDRVIKIASVLKIDPRRLINGGTSIQQWK